MDFMQNGGANMWLMLASAVLAAVVAATRPAPKRAGVLRAATVLLLIEGMFGLALGMIAVSANAGRFPDVPAAIATGLGELANNGAFGAILALLLGIGSLVADRAASRA